MEDDAVMVLGAIRRGKSGFGKIQGATGIEPGRLDEILRGLEEAGLIRAEERKGWLGRKVEITATEEGTREVERRLGDLQVRWGKMAAMYKTGNKEGVRRMMDENRSFLPMMMFFGVMDMAMLGMMFGLMGASMSDYVPADSVPPGADAGAGDFDFDVGF